MKTLQQIAGEVISRARVRQGIRADVANDTVAQFGEALTALRAELGDDAMLEWVVRETIQQMDAQTEAQEEEERAAQRRFIPFLDYGDEPPARSPSMAQYLD
jgi:hypothetical protein